MRTYRVVYRSLVASERLSQVSDSAAALFPLLLLCQDDAGIVLWTPLSRRIITATRVAWSSDDAERFLTELVTVGMVERQSDITLLIRRGAELNGPPNHGRPEHKRPQLYANGTFSLVSSDVHGTYKVRIGDAQDKNAPPTLPDTERDAAKPNLPILPNHTTDTETRLGGSHGKNDAVRTGYVSDTDRISGREENRGEENRGEKQQPSVAFRASRSPTHEPITDEYLNALQVSYPTLNVRSELANAQNRKQWDDYKDKRRAFVAWLDRSVRFAAPPSLFRPGPSANSHGPTPDKYEVERKRIAKLGVAKAGLDKATNSISN